MEVRYRQHLGGACSKPFIASVGLTLRAMPISTRVKRDGVMTTLRTAVFVSAERSGAAVLNSTKNANVLPRYRATALLYKIFANLAKNIGHLQRRPVHFLSRCLGRLTEIGKPLVRPVR